MTNKDAAGSDQVLKPASQETTHPQVTALWQEYQTAQTNDPNRAQQIKADLRTYGYDAR